MSVLLDAPLVDHNANYGANSWHEAMEYVGAIAGHARARNLRSGVTGIMSYDCELKQVWQVLEGAPASVMPIWDNISADSRHDIDVDTVVVRPVVARIFPSGWGMALRMRGADLV